MKKHNFYLLLILSILLFITSCTKKQELDITMTQVNHGQLDVQVIDSQGTPMENIDVRLGGGFSSDLEIKTTDGNGWVHFHNILAGNYAVYIDNMVLNGNSFDIMQGVQVVSNSTKTYTIVPSEYIGTAKITVLAYNNSNDQYEPVQAGLKVYLFNADMYINDSSIPSIAMDSETTNTQGQVEFTELPFNSYGIGVFDEQDDLLGVDQYFFSINRKGQEEKRFFYVSE